VKNIENKLIPFLFLVILTFLFPLTSFSDTFTNLQTGEVLHGYATSRTEDSKKVVQTSQKGPVALNMSEWNVTADRQGRNNKVVVITFDRMIMYEIETAAMIEALRQAVDAGPLFILIQLDTPGGRLDLAQKLCAAITQADRTQVVCFVSGGENGGAISAGAALALACDKIYMAQNTVIGGATMITVTSEGGPASVKQAYGDEVGEKFSSIWQANLASLAEKNGRPGLLARAMVDKDIEVIEVIEGQKRLFINPVNKTDSQKIVKTWSQKDSLLTLTAKEALDCMIADGIIDSQVQLLRELKAADAEIINNNDVQLAGNELSRAQLKV
jgi:membrane-bound ClpP family serine protease